MFGLCCWYIEYRCKAQKNLVMKMRDVGGSRQHGCSIGVWVI